MRTPMQVLHDRRATAGQRKHDKAQRKLEKLATDSERRAARNAGESWRRESAGQWRGR
jgi:hypothetical protein